jgi:hypothetical protein
MTSVELVASLHHDDQHRLALNLLVWVTKHIFLPNITMYYTIVLIAGTFSLVARPTPERDPPLNAVPL